MASAFVDYFEYLFSSSNPFNLDSVMRLMNRRLSNEMVVELDRDFTVKEVK